MSIDMLDKYEKAKEIMRCCCPSREVFNDVVLPHWIESGPYFWYSRETKVGKEYRLVNAETGSNEFAFDHVELALLLSQKEKVHVDFENLPLMDNKLSIKLSPLLIEFEAFDKAWVFDPENSKIESIGLETVSKSTGIACADQHSSELPNNPDALLSPCGAKAIYTRDYNIWMWDKQTGQEHALTKDGYEDYKYATDLFDGDTVPQALWSPDSTKIFTLVLDAREVKPRPFVSYLSPSGEVNSNPEISLLKAATAGDKHVEVNHLLVIDVNTKDVRKIDYDPLPIINFGDPLQGFFRLGLGWWSLNNQDAYFVEVTRGSKTVRLVKLDVESGATLSLFEEESDTFVKLAHGVEGLPLLLPLPQSNELIWFSERSGWGHLYLYNLDSGELVHPITGGEWLVREILHFDPEKRELLLQTAGRDPECSPYYRDICKVNIDTGNLTTLVSGCFDYRVYRPTYNKLGNLTYFHNIDLSDIDGVSPSGQYIVTTYSRVDTVPVSILIDTEGNRIADLEVADVSALPDDWQWPEPVKLVSADDKTDIYGIIFRPPNYSPDKSYPVIDYSNSSRWACDLPQGSFCNSPYISYDYMLPAALAALGFIVVMIEGRGTPLRDKSFQDYHYGDPAYGSDFNDRISGLRQLAHRYPYMDLQRVGITGIECQTNTIYGLLNHADFYKVAVVHHLFDPAINLAFIGETYDGTSHKKDKEKSITKYDVESFDGKLLLIQGMFSVSTPAGTFGVVEALQKSNKDFDMLCLPNLILEMTSYTTRREWDYLVKNLLDEEPPRHFNLVTGKDIYH